MRVLLAEHDHAIYADLLRAAQPDLDLVISDDPTELASLAPDCPVWLGEPDLLATVL
ncbi:MAG: D-2-hydroxyacid dehydrogenase, partial [Pseudomonas sp.]